MTTAIDVVRKQFESQHNFLMMAVDGCDQATADRQPDGATIQPISAVLAHILMAEDTFVNTMATQRGPFLQRGGWADRLNLPTDNGVGLSGDMAAARPNIEALREFAQALGADVDEALASITPEQAEAEIDGPFGKSTVVDFLSGIGISHLSMHTGEISALRGVFGQKGLPF